MIKNVDIISKNELCKMIVADCKGQTDKRLTLEDSKKILELLPDVVAKLLATDRIVRIQGLMDFEPIIREEHISKNPKTQESITVAKTRVVKITKSRAFSTKVKATYEEPILTETEINQLTY